jgi:DNA-binding NarL/FixJ family response regulator
VSAPLVLSAAAIILCALFFLWFQRYIRRNTGPREIMDSYREEISRLIVDINAVTDRSLSLIEERAKSLNALLEEIDKKLALYAREFDRRRGAETIYTALGRSPKPVPPPEPLPPPEPAAGNRPPPEAPETRPVKEQVAELAAQGFSPDAIAARLKVSVSEVELIIAIRDRSQG